MAFATNATWLQLIAPSSQSVTYSTANAFTGAISSNVIDTLGYDYAEIIANVGAMTSAAISSATSTGLSPMSLWESDTRTTVGLSSGLQVPGASFGISQTVSAPTSLYPETAAFAASVTPTSAYANSLWLINVDLKGRKRYLQFIVTASTAGTTAASFGIDAIARMSRNEVTPHLPSQAVFASTASVANSSNGVIAGQVLQVPALGTLSGTATTFNGAATLAAGTATGL